MKDKSKSKKGSKPAKSSCCYHVVDGCGCVVGSLCCKGPNMTECRLVKC